MTTISVGEIERDPDGYLRRVEAGEAFLIVRNDRPVAEIKPVPNRPDHPRPIGLARGEFTVPSDFDSPLPDRILQEFEHE